MSLRFSAPGRSIGRRARTRCCELPGGPLDCAQAAAHTIWQPATPKATIVERTNMFFPPLLKCEQAKRFGASSVGPHAVARADGMATMWIMASNDCAIFVRMAFLGGPETHKARRRPGKAILRGVLKTTTPVP